MIREDITKLHFVTAIENVPSMLEHGILSNGRATGLAHRSLAMPEVQRIDNRDILLFRIALTALHEP